jgi:3-deoxy-7-phosphoheptulonate synthase
MTEESTATVLTSREAIADIIKKRDHRLLAVVGPCSIHDPKAAIEYASRLNELRNQVKERINLVMRVYFEKPRTTTGWRGLITDPKLDGSYDIARGLRTARSLLLEITGMGLPTGSEMLDPIVPQYIADLISWASIGARTTESQIHRELASGLSMPIGFKNGTDGSLQNALNALLSTRSSHSFIGIDQAGRTCVLRTSGNDDGHIILRGGKRGPNYHAQNVQEAEALFEKHAISPAIVVDCSHDNSRKNHTMQNGVLESVIETIGEQRNRGGDSIVGFMVESNLEEGNQRIPADLRELRYGVSITDECVGWDQTREMILRACDKVTDASPSGVE